jgi:hypothetical protein
MERAENIDYIKNEWPKAHAADRNRERNNIF